MLINGRIYLTIPWTQKERTKLAGGRQWHKEKKQWSWPVISFRALLHNFPDQKAEIERDIAEYYDKPQESTSLKDIDEMALRDPARDIEAEVADIEIPRNADLRIDIGGGRYGKPFKHQETMIKLGLKYQQHAYFCEMGTGKTIAIIMLIKCLRAQGHEVRALIVCPKSVIHSWTTDLDKCGIKEYNLVNGSKSQRQQQLAHAAELSGIAIINYDSLVPTGEEAPWARYNFVVLDESSRIKSPKAQRTKFTLRNFGKSTWRYILSGTPITQNPCDIYCQYHFLSLDFLGYRSYYSFRNTYMVMGGYQGYEVVGLRHQEELRKKIGRHSIQLKKEECLDLPEKTFTTRFLDMPKSLAAQYKQMEKDCILELDGETKMTAPIVLTKVMRLQQILGGVHLKDNENEKLKALQEIIIEVVCESKKQLVIWARFKDTIKLIAKALGYMDIKYGILTGDTTQDERTQLITDFQAGKVQVFLGNAQAGGLGINLWAASTTVYYENSFSLEERKQSEDRIHRIGQKNTCTYIDLCYNKTVDVDVIKAIQRKQDMSTFLVDSFLKGTYEVRNAK